MLQCVRLCGRSYVHCLGGFTLYRQVLARGQLYVRLYTSQGLGAHCVCRIALAEGERGYGAC